MAKFVRDSKLRNVYGNSFKKDQFFESLRVSKHNNVAMVCEVNPKFVAVAAQAAGGGSFYVLKHSQTGRLSPDAPQVCGHKAAVIDIAFSPFDDHMIASCDDNGGIMIWEIPEEGVTENITKPLVELDLHQKRVSLIKWHPVVAHVLMSAGLDNLLIVWNLDDGEPLLEVTLKDVIQDMCWSYNGSFFATATKDKTVRVYNPRSGAVEKEIKPHESPREMRIALLKDDLLLTTGFSRVSQRQYALWDLKKKDYDKSMMMDELDQTNAPLNIFYDPDLSMAYLVGKGDTVIRYYEINSEAPYFHYINTFQSKEVQRGMGSMPKRGLNVNQCEAMRLYKVVAPSAVGYIEPISFIVPRKSELYQADIYPDTKSNEPALSISEWWNGKDAKPLFMNMQQFYVSKEKDSGSKSGGLGKKKGLGGGSSGLKKVTVAEPAPKAEPEPKPAAKVAASTPKSWQKPVTNSNSQSHQIEDLVAEIERLKATVAKQEQRIAALERAK